jgi:hypothetical protein
MPLADLRERRLARDRIEVVLAQGSRQLHRLTELRQVLAAVHARVDVLLEPRTVAPGERASR